jgi:DNA-binding IclR family transcriptional regulator
VRDLDTGKPARILIAETGSRRLSHEMKRRGSPDGEPGSATHVSLARGLRLVETVALNGGAISLAEAARRTGLHRSTAHHLLQTLVGLEYLRQDPASRGYELAAKPFLLTGRTWSPESLARIAQPFLAELARRSGEGASLAAYRDGAVTVVAKREHDGPVRVVQDIGAQRPIHCTAVAKAIIPWLPPAELAGLLGRVRFERHTPKTITTRSELDAEVRRVRAAGYAIDDEEHLEGIRCIAMPVFGHAGQVVASMCAVGPKSRMTHQKLRDLRAPLGELAQALSEQLGWRADAAAPDGRRGPIRVVPEARRAAGRKPGRAA